MRSRVKGSGHNKTHFNICMCVYVVLQKRVKWKCGGIDRCVMFLLLLKIDIKQHNPPFTHIKKVKESRNRPSVAQSVPGGLGSQIS